MKGRVDTLQMGGHSLAVFCPEVRQDVRLPVIYMNTGRPQDWDGYLPKLASMMGKSIRPALLVSLSPTDWSADFSPWKADGLHEGSAPFAGKANERINLIADAAKPLIDQSYPTLSAPCDTGIFGYSLGGLAALYALYERGDVFGMAGCLSGSLWFEGFMDYQRAHIMTLDGARVYLSLGRKEEKTRHPLMNQIGTCYEETCAMLKKQLGEEQVAFTLHNGGHGTEVEQRMLAGLQWLLAC